MKTKISNIGISGIASAYPKNKITLTELSYLFGKDAERIANSTGIRSLRIAPPNMSVTDLCRAACSNLLENLNVNPLEIDGLIFVSQTPAQRMPATSGILQHQLGLLQESVVFDINQGCSGYINGLYLSSSLISSGGCKRILLCTGDVLTHYLNPEEKSVRMVFGDGASATLIESRENEDIHFVIKSDGSGADSLYLRQKEKDFLFRTNDRIFGTNYKV